MNLLPIGYSDFLLGKRNEYEDHSIRAVRNPDGSCEITGKPLSPVFIYADPYDPDEDDEDDEETLP